MYGDTDMPPSPTPLDDPVLERSLAKGGLGKASTRAANEPVYKVIGDSKIPVSKSTGVLWQGRKDQGLHARGEVATTWDEAIRYYGNDQLSNRGRIEGGGNRT